MLIRDYMTVRKKVSQVQSVGRRLRGLSAFGLGASWEYPPSERETVRKLIVFLEDRRALFNPPPAEVEDCVVASVQSIREECTKAIATLPEASHAVASIRAIRAACRRFLDDPYPTFSDIAAQMYGPRFREAFDAHQYRLRIGTEPAGFFTALGEMRAFVGQQIALLATAYEIDVEGDLASILPPAIDGEVF
jgi:hypothetical protein